MSVATAFNPDYFAALGTTNQGWGVCGFTSVCYAIYAMNPGRRGKIVNATNHFAVLSDIKMFLVQMQANGEHELLREIEMFNRSFPGCGSFKLNEYLQLINKTYAEAVSRGRWGADYADDSWFGIGMPPNAVAKYLQAVEGYDTTIFFPSAAILGSRLVLDPGCNAIVGVRNPAKTKLKLYRGLCHWMYRYHGKIYSWGREFNTIEDAGAHTGSVYELCCLIYTRAH